MSYQPPFTITSKIIDLVSQISEKIGEVQRDFSNASPQLRKQNRIKTITGTLQIEGNPLWLPLFSYARSKGDHNKSKGNHKGLPLREIKSPIKGQPQGVARTL